MLSRSSRSGGGEGRAKESASGELDFTSTLQVYVRELEIIYSCGVAVAWVRGAFGNQDFKFL